MSEQFDLISISLGAGVQSSTLYRMAALGEIPGRMPDVAIFADTGCESSHTYKTLDLLEKDHGDVIPIQRVSVGNLAEDWFHGQESTVRDERAMGAAIPVHIRNPDGSKGMGARSCSHRYKLTPIFAAMRCALGLKKGARAKGVVKAESWIGISTDEFQRVKDSTNDWIVNRYPLIYDVPMSRADCLKWLQNRDFPIAERSSCTFCPYHSNAEWRALKARPEDWAKAVEFDERLRSEKRYVSSAGDPEKAQFKGIPYVHSSRVPLTEANLFDHDDRQINLFNQECDGICGV